MNGPLHGGPTIGSQALRVLARHPGRIAFSWDGGQMTYGAARELIGRLQRVFAAAGLGRGDRMAFLTGNRAEVWCASIAAQASGIAITWLHPLASAADQLFQIEDCAAAALVVDPIHHHERGGELASAAALVFTAGPARYGTDLLAAADAAGACSPQDLARADDTAILNYTGGTTGRSKGVARSHAMAAPATAAILADFEIPREPRYLAVAPISHVAGTKIIPVLARGGTVHMTTGFAADRLLRTISRERINMTLLVPTMIYGLLDHPGLDDADLSMLELVLYGAAPISPTRLMEAMARIGPVFSQLYGQSECYPISVLRKGDHDASQPELLSSCGIPVMNCEVKLLGDDGQEVPQGEPGEICVRCPHIMASYWNRPDETASALEHGWLHTGDIAKADERGYLYIVDRKKDMIVSGGFNVYPREVEDALTAHPDVSMAAVIGVPDERWGEAVMAVVVLRADAAADAAALQQFVKEKKGSMLTPKRIEFVEALPVTAVGKIDKKAIRAKYWAGRARMLG
ncbi:AMP-binding protein [Rhodoligotrophos defluvii]|uniref:AMP-binding protein n=1 Tax=Rhodoligotrophos defluvii TaxID=2561934 RepID=UPI0010C9AE12|nr:AMP-binding protein [Rhodoligotrophos defluvii]